MITRLRLENFKRHDYKEINFTPGVNVICGGNYQGKSTILHGILFALWGVSSVPGGGAQVQKRGASGKATSWLDLVVDGAEVAIKRTGGSATLWENGKEVARGTTAVNGRVEDLLGVTKADFNRIKYSEQQETASLLTFGATGLNLLIERVSGADLISGVMAQAKAVKVRQDGVLSAITVVDLKPIEEKLDKASDAVMTASALHDALVSSMDAQLNLRSSSKRVLDEAEAHNHSVNSQLTQMKNLSSSIDWATDKVASDKEELARYTGASEDEYKGLLTQASNLEKASEQEAALTRKLLKLRRGFKEKREVMLELEGIVEASRQSVALLETSREGLDISLEALPARRELVWSLKEKLATARSLLTESICPTCQRPYEGCVDRVQVEADIADLTERMLLAVPELTNLEAKELELKKVVEDLISVKHKLERTIRVLIPELESEIKATRTEIQVADVELANLPEHSEADLQDLQERVTAQAKTLRAKATAEGSLSSSERSLADAQAKLKAMPALKALIDVEPLKKAYSLSSDEIQKAQLEQQHARSQVVTAKDDTERLSEVLEVARINNAKVDEAEKLSDVAGRLHKFLKENREKFMAAIWDKLLTFASTMVSNVTGGYVSSMFRRNDAFFFVENGEESALAGASGAQKSLMGAALKSALSVYLPDSLSCLLLDEATADMDDPHAHAMTSLLGTIGHQVIAVSHREMDRSGDHNIIQL